ncbi:MAG: hypothetical protein ACLQOO_26550 [Terriglobia bacterium]
MADLLNVNRTTLYRALAS